MNTGHVPMRKCVGCMTSKPKSELIRIGIENNENEVQGLRSRVSIDTDNSFNGRGAYLCKSRACFEAARKRRTINRTLKREVIPEDYERMGEFFDKY